MCYVDYSITYWLIAVSEKVEHILTMSVRMPTVFQKSCDENVFIRHISSLVFKTEADRDRTLIT